MKHLKVPLQKDLRPSNLEGLTMPIAYAIKEGMIDFIEELLSGKNANERQLTWPTLRLEKSWDSFKKEMYLGLFVNKHITNTREQLKDITNPGYWIGYQIYESYFGKAVDKKQAVYNMIFDDRMREEQFDNLISA